MRFFPYLSETFHSLLPPPEVLRRVQEMTVSPPGATQPARPCFVGTVHAAAFAVERIADERNSFLPQIRASVAERPGQPGSRVHLRHRLHPGVLAFMGVWLGITTPVAVLVTGAMLQQHEFSGPGCIPVGMCLFGFALLNLPFWSEVKTSRALLVERLELQPAI